MITSGGAILCWAYMCRAIDSEIKPDTWKEESVKRLEEMPLWPANWMEHQTRDDYWKHGSVSVNYDDIKVPVFALDGWADSYTNSVLTLMEGLSVPRKALIDLGHMYLLMTECLSRQLISLVKLQNGGING